MKKTLFIYDDNGKIFTQITGDYIKPVGLQHLEIEVPQGKFVTGVDTSVSPHQVILNDIPKSEVEILREKLAQQEEAMVELAGLVAEVLG